MAANGDTQTIREVFKVPGKQSEFTLGYNPVPNTPVFVFRNGLFQAPSLDYNQAGRRIALLDFAGEGEVMQFVYSAASLQNTAASATVKTPGKVDTKSIRDDGGPRSRAHSVAERSLGARVRK